MRNLWRRWACALLTAVLLLAAAPAPAYAAVGELVRNTMLENSALLAALREAYGDDAETYLALLQSYGLVDSRGSLMTDEKITVDGKDYTLEELEAYLSDPAVDLTQAAEVDGTYVTLEGLKLVLEIEQYLAYVEATYFTEQDLTDEQKASFYDLAQAWAGGELSFTGGTQPLAVNALTDEGPSGIDHGVQLSVTAADTATANGTYTITVIPTKAQGQDVTFSWRAVSGSIQVAGGGDITIPANSTAPVTLTVQVSGCAGKIKGQGTFVVQLYDLENALFENGSNGATRWEKTVSVTRNDAFKYRGTVEAVFSYDGDFYSSGEDLTIDGNDEIGTAAVQQTGSGNFYGSGATATLTVPDLDGSFFQGDLSITPKFTRTSPVYNSLLMSRDTWPSISFWGPSIDRSNNPYNWRTSDAYQILEHSADTTLKYQISASGSDGAAKGEAINDSVIVNFEDVESTSVSESISGFTVIPGETISAKMRDSVMHAMVVILYGTQLWFVPAISGTATLEVWDTTTNLNAQISAPAGTYYPGQNIPLTVTFTNAAGEPYPMEISSSMTLTVNGTVLRPAETGTTAECCTFLYEVQETDGAGLTVSGSSLNGTGANGLSISVNSTGLNGTLDGVVLRAPDRADAFTDFQLDLGADANNKPLLLITAQLNTADRAYTDWVLSELQGSDGVWTLDALQASVDGPDNGVSFTTDSESPTVLTATIPLDYNNTGEDIHGQVEFWLDGKLLLGQALEYTLEPSVAVAAGDMTPTLTVTPAGEDTGTAYTPENGEDVTVPLLYAQQDNALDLSFTLAGSGYTWGDKTKVSYIQADGTVADPSAHFAWRSSNSDAASFRTEETGAAVLVPTGRSGDTRITLVALNGGQDTTDAEGNVTPVGLPDTESAGIQLTFAVGQDPFLMIPQSGQKLSLRQGNNAVVNWSSNLCQKNEGTAPDGLDFTPTTFHVQAYRISGGTAEETPFWTADLTTGTGEGQQRTISSVEIPWSVLEPLYTNGIRQFQVAVSAQYGGQWYGTYDLTEAEGDEADNATAQVTMVSRPASVELLTPEGGLYQTDNGAGRELALEWTISDLEQTGDNAGSFELYIASDALPQPIVVSDLSQVTQTGDHYSYTFNVPAVELTNDPTSYRDSYTITVKAKNNRDATWAYSSYVLYVYSANALEILLDGEEADDTLTMSNVDRIADLWNTQGSAGIVALKRDISLRNVISINYGEYAWAELADQIAWESSNSQVATVNYQQGTLYENIEDFSYTTYRPATDFVLSGLSDGTTTVTAQHRQTGISDSLTVNVETLRDRLYLFQCYPNNTVTTLTYQVYTNAERSAVSETRTVQTNTDGEAAIYAPYGIAGNVYCQSETQEDGETVTWLGTIRNSSLVSSEADSTKLQLYPVNTLQLRRAAYADIYLKAPDGKPYTGTVTFRGGVYRQGEYCGENVRFGLQDDQPNGATGKPGNVDYTVTLEEADQGHLRVTMDISQFTTDSQPGAVQAGEKIEYIFLLEAGSGTEYYPLMLRMDAALNAKEVMASGDSITAWTANEAEGDAPHPFIAMQTLQYSDAAAASKVSVKDGTGSVGPSTTFPNAWVTTTVLWCGDEASASAANTVTLRDTTGRDLPGQTSRRVTYPFSDMAFTENVVALNDANMRTWGVDCYRNRSVEALFSRDGSSVDQTQALPFRIVNMIGAQPAEEAAVLKDTLGGIQSSLGMDATQAPGAGESLMGTSDKLIQAGMELVAGDASYDSSQDTFAVRLTATSDPTVFRAFFCLNVGNMSSGGNESGIYPSYTDMEDMAFAQADVSSGNDLDVMPNAMNIYRMLTGSYLDSVLEEGMDAAQNKAVRSFNFDLGGYFEADIVYNSETGSWECRPISGGFHAGGGLNYSWYVNMLVGPVPVNVSLTLGGSLEVSLDMQRGTYYTAPDSVYTELVGAGSQETFDSILDSSYHTTSTGTDYLTALRLFLYIRVFAGIGFDISVLACKIGVFGQLSADLNFNWLNRNYLQDGAAPDGSGNVSAVGPLGSRDDALLAGQEPRFSGSTGIEFVFKFLFVSYEKVFCSVGFEVDGQYGDWTTIEEIWQANQTINNEPVTRMVLSDGQVFYAVDLGAQLESRDYVDTSNQLWVGDMASNALDENQALVSGLQTGAYPYANPVLSDDGTVMLYLSDRGGAPYDDPKDITNTRVAVSAQENGVYQEGVRFDDRSDVPTGYGDSSLRTAGERGGYAAVWVRQMENITPEDTAQGTGGTLTDGDQMLQFNSTEIVAATSADGTNWNLQQLTANTTPDLAPVVAASGSRAVAAWREVNSSSADGITDFDQQDVIRYSVFDGNSWSASQILYDGTGSGATVRGIEAAMLSDGTAAVVYTLDQNAADGSNQDWETVKAILPAGAASEDTVRTFQLTSDASLDENPQIAAVTCGDGTERFVIAWHTEQPVADTGETESDIRLAALDRNGVLYSAMPESLGQSAAGTGVDIGSNFRFAKNAETIGNLAILWVDSVSPDKLNDKTYDDSSLDSAVSGSYSAQHMGHDVLQAVKFVEQDGSYTVSGAVEVASMEANRSLIDSFDAYVAPDHTVKYVLLATDYSEVTQKTVEISDGETERTATLTVPNPISGMYTATAEFVNQIELSAVSLEYDQLYLNSTADVPFTIRNSGKDVLTALRIESADGGRTYYDTADDSLYNGNTGKLNLMPNRDLTVTARVPIGSEITNTEYRIVATFANGDTVTLPGTLYLDLPDVGISKLEVTTEADGLRTLRYSLYNALPANLADSKDGWRVQVGFYTDQACTEPLTGTDGRELVQTIDSPADLALIDAGGYSGSVTFDIAGYVQSDGSPQEIPESGVTVYAKAWVEQAVSETPAGTQALLRQSGRTASYESILEYHQGNNTTSTTLENLAVRRGEDVTVRSTLDNSGTGSQVTVDLQYNKITGTAQGNVIVTLLDENGRAIAKQQSYFQQGQQLLDLTKEETASVTFPFEQKGASVLVDFSSVVEGSADLSGVSLSGAQVEYDPSTGTYTATGAGLTSGILNLLPEDPNASIIFNGAPYDGENPVTIQLPYGTTVWPITVTCGGQTQQYKLRLVNTDPSASSGSGGGSESEPSFSPDIEAGAGGSVSTNPRTPEEGETVTITVTPEPGYAVDSISVTDRNGSALDVRDNGDGTYTFVQPHGRVTITVTFVRTGEIPFFVDVPETFWAYPEILWAFENGYVNGTSATTFSPNGAISRQQVWMILARLSGASPANMAEARTWAMEHGISDGTNPGNPVTRQQLVALLFRYASGIGRANDERANLSIFPDADRVADYAVEPMEWSVANDIVSGTSQGTLNPTGTATRAQFAVILYRFWTQLD